MESHKILNTGGAYTIGTTQLVKNPTDMQCNGSLRLKNLTLLNALTIIP